MRIAKEALTFDDVLLQPGYSEVLPHEVDLGTFLTRSIRLNIPILSAAMDTVTEARLAIALAQEGGLGIIHRNMPIEQQAREVMQVKKFESGIVRNPITVAPDMTIGEVIELTHAMGISGVPVVDGRETVGIVTGRDLRFETRFDAPVSEVMTPKERLVTVGEDADNEEVKSLLHRHRIEKVLVVDRNFELKGMITAKDFQKAKDFPHSCKDDHGALRVGAAVGTGYDSDDRVAALVEAGVDVVVVDTAQRRARPGPAHQEGLSAHAGGRRQHRHGGCGRGIGRGRRRRRQSRYRTRFDLYHAGRGRRRRAADLRGRRGG